MTSPQSQSIRQWFENMIAAGRSRHARRRRSALTSNRLTFREISIDVDPLEERIVLDARLDFRDFTLVATGDGAEFQTNSVVYRANNRPANFASLGGLDYASFPLYNSPNPKYDGTDVTYGTVISSTNRIEVWHKASQQKVYVLPEGGQFREFAFNPMYLELTGLPSNTPKYADIVPRFGLVEIDNGETFDVTSRWVQTVKLDGDRSDAKFKISWNGSTTAELDRFASASDIERELQNLRSIRDAKLRVKVDSTTRGFTTTILTLTFTAGDREPSLVSIETIGSEEGKYGPIALMKASVEVPSTKRAKELNVTNRDAQADNNGRGIILPLTGLLPLSGATDGVPTSIYMGSSLSTAFRKNVGYWPIPDGHTVSMQVRDADIFTPTHLGAYQLNNEGTRFETRLLGRVGWNGYEVSLSDDVNPGAKQLGRFNGGADNSGGFRVVAGNEGFKSVFADQITRFTIQAANKDSNGQNQPKTFRLAGLNFEMLTANKADYDRSTGKLKLVTADTNVILKTVFQGGTLTIKVSALEFDTRSRQFQISSPQLQQLDIGGFRFIPPGTDNPNGIVMSYDVAAERFTFTVQNSSTSSDPRKSNAVFLPGASIGINSVNLSLAGGQFAISKGVLEGLSSIPLKMVQLVRRSNNGNGQQVESLQNLSTAGAGLFLSFNRDTRLNSDKSVRVPPNTFVIHGQSTSPITTSDLTVPGPLNFGSADQGQFQVANGRLVQAIAGIQDFTFSKVKFVADTANGASPLKAAYFSPVEAESQSWTITGATSVSSGVSAISAGMKIGFGDSGTEGIVVTVADNTVLASGVVSGEFRSGTSVLRSRDGQEGVRLNWQPAEKKLALSGKANLEINGFDPSLEDYSTLSSGSELGDRQAITSPNGRFAARNEWYVRSPALQGTALVVRDTQTGRVVWASIQGGSVIQMQTDGNLVLKARAGDKAISDTSGNPGAFLALFNDGNLAVISPTKGILWQTNTRGSIAIPNAAMPVSMTPPSGATGVGANLLNGDKVLYYFDRPFSINGLTLSPLPTASGLRVETKAGLSQMLGDFSMTIGGRTFYASMNAASISNGALPTDGITFDFTRVPNTSTDWAVGGVVLTGLQSARLTDNNTKMQLLYPKAAFEKRVLTDGKIGKEPNRIVVTRGQVSAAEVVSAVPQTLGDYSFEKYSSNYDFRVTPSAWIFTGPATYYGKKVEIGKGGDNPELRIGSNSSNPSAGPQLLATNIPYDVGPLSFPLPNVVNFSGLNFDPTKFSAQVAEEVPRKYKVYKLTTNDYIVNIGQTSVTFSGEMKIKLSENKPEILSLAANAKQDSKFTIGNASIQVKTISLAWNIDRKQFEISGNARFTVTAGAGTSTLDVNLGDAKTPGLVIRDGMFQSLAMSVQGEFRLFGMTIAANGVSIQYNREDQQYVIFGNIVLNSAKQGGVQVIKDMNVSLGSSASKPGLVIVSGVVQSLDISLNGEINLFNISANAEKLRFRYSAEENQLQITGGISATLAKGFVVRASLPGKGLLIDTETGAVQVRGLRLSAENEIRFGVLSIRNLDGFFQEDSQGNVSFGASATIALPSGLEVSGAFKVVKGTLDSISVRFQKNPGILVANGLINIYSIEGSVSGLSDLEDFTISATVRATVGPKVAFAGQSFALADVAGRITITKEKLVVDGRVDLVGGIFGNGKFKGVLRWADTPSVTFDAEIVLYPGEIIRGTMHAMIDANGNVDFDAGIGVYIPNQLPAVGGKRLGELGISLRIRPAEPSSNSYARFSFQILNVNGSVKASFDATVRYDLSVDFWLFSINIGGSFSLLDSAAIPSIQILSASSISGTPDAKIVFRGDSDEVNTIIDLYADHDASGHDGTLIGSGIPLSTADQTYVWQNMGSLIEPGEKIYVYAVIRDRNDQTVFSDYSLPFTVSTDFDALVVAPTELTFVAGENLFFTGSSRVFVEDPRKKYYADSEVLVSLDTYAGVLQFPGSTKVSITGAGTRHATLRGRQDDINSVLSGLTYVSRSSAIFDDKLEVGIQNLPLESLASKTTKSIDLHLQSLQISETIQHDSDGIAETSIFVGADATPLTNITISSQTSNWLTGASIQIDQFMPGQELLDLSFNDEQADGISADFDATTGTLILSGFGTIDDYESAIRQVVFSTKVTTASRKLLIRIADDQGEHDDFSVRLNVEQQHRSPRVFSPSSGIVVRPSDASSLILPSVELEVFNDQQITQISISFEDDSYKSGEDVLGYFATESDLTASFDAVAGTLVIQGVGTADEWQEALQNVYIASLDDKFTPGTRFLEVTVTDLSYDNSDTSILQVIQKQTNAALPKAPSTKLSQPSIALKPHSDFQLLDPGLLVQSEMPKLVAAKVAIASGFRAGEQSLAVSFLPSSLDAEFNELTGELTITGVASLDDYQRTLQSIVFLDTAGPRTEQGLQLHYTVSDGISTSIASVLSVAVPDLPYLNSDVSDVLVYTNGRQSNPINPEMEIQYSDTLTGAKIRFAGGYLPDEDRLVFSNQSGISGVFRVRSGILELTGTATVQQYETAINSVRYYNSRYNPSEGDRILEYAVNSAEGWSDAVESLIRVEPELLSPQLSLGGQSTVFKEDGAPVLIAPRFDVSGMDATDTFLSEQSVLQGIEIAILNYHEGEDHLLFTDLESIQGVWNAEEGRLFLYGVGSFADYESAVRTVQYWNSSDAPDTSARSIRSACLMTATMGFRGDSSHRRLCSR